MAAKMDARTLASTLTSFVDVMIPGDETFPPASVAGANGLVAERIRERLDGEAFNRIVSALNREEPFAAAEHGRQVEIVQNFSEQEPELFRFLRFATYYSYYEMPAVITAIQSLGHDYNDAPQPLGYALPPFNPAINLPEVPRGSYKKTEEITRIDLSMLADLGLPVKGA